MKKVIRSTNDLLLAVLMGAASIFLLTSDKVITGVENGLGGAWAQASTYIHLLAGILLALSVLQLIYAINFKANGEHQKLHIPVSKEIIITAVSLVLYALLLDSLLEEAEELEELEEELPQPDSMPTNIRAARAREIAFFMYVLLFPFLIFLYPNPF